MEIITGKLIKSIRYRPLKNDYLLKKKPSQSTPIVSQEKAINSAPYHEKRNKTIDHTEVYLCDTWVAEQEQGVSSNVVHPHTITCSKNQIMFYTGLE